MNEHPDDRPNVTPEELCERWSISLRTLDKFELPWVWLSSRVRRIRLRDVRAFEQRHHLNRQST